MLDEILKSIRSYLYERAVSPLIGSFIISWGIWNYKFLLLLFSGLNVTQKYQIIDNSLFATWQQIYLRGGLYPLLTALAYLYLYPYPAIKVFEFSRNRQKEITDIKKKIDQETLLTKKESYEIQAQIYKLEEEIETQLLKKDKEIDRLKGLLKSNDKKATTPINWSTSSDGKLKADNSTEDDKKLSDGQVKLLLAIGLSDDGISKSQLEPLLKESKIVGPYNLLELESLNYIKNEVEKIGGGPVYTLTQKGRAYLIENKIVG